jgi:hypothetical protein
MQDRAVRMRVSGPLAECAEGTPRDARRRGCAPSLAAGQLQMMTHLSRWLGLEDRRAGDLDRLAVERLGGVRRPRRPADVRQSRRAGC